MKKIGMVLVLVLTLAVSKPAFATSAFVPNDAFKGPEATQAPAQTDEQTVQDQGIITLEARRTFAGEQRHSIGGDTVAVQWTAGVAYEENRQAMGKLRHVWVFTESPGAEIDTFTYKYERSPAKDAATLTLAYTVLYEGEAYDFEHVFSVTPDGDGAKYKAVRP